jgi:hypothetical protein
MTFRQGADGAFTEDRLYRNLHPMLAKRLDLWRLSNFTLERLPSTEDVYLFFGVAHENPKDRRLFAVAEVRDLVAVRDDQTGAQTYPRLGRIGLQALAAMRTALSHYPPRERPTANRLVLNVRPVWEIPGARISMDSGTENMDWVAAALRRIVEFTQAGHEINVVVAGINVGAQPYWNAEATMLMHTKGILVMTPDSAMVLTGKQSLDFSGGVSAEDNFGIGGYDRVMGPNGQAQYWAPNLGAPGHPAGHYDHTYVAPGEDAPRRAVTSDPVDRDVSDYPHAAEGSEFTTVGEIFSHATNPDRKKPFDIRTVIAAVCDADHPRVERWAGMADAETAVVMDARVGGHTGLRARASSPSRCRDRASLPPTARHLHRGTLFPPVVARRRPGRSTRPPATGRSSCWPTCPASTAPPSRCATCSWSTAPRSAGPS